MEKPTGSAPAGAKDQVEKQARQLAYDVRYKVRQSLKAQSGGKSDPATVRKAYLSQLGKSPASPPVKARAKAMLIGEDYVNVNKLATESAVSALYRVFVEGIQEEEPEEIKEGSDEKTYKVRVTDKKSGNSYVRMASRAKISELRNNPNISSVEMTGYGEPTRAAGVDTKKKEKKEDDGDKVESSGAESVGESWKDGFSELIEKKKTEEKKITGKGVNNKDLVKVFPVEESKDYGSQTARQGDNEAAAAARKRIYNRATPADQDYMDAREISHQRNKKRAEKIVSKEEITPDQEGGVDKTLKSKQKKLDIIKKQVLLKKLQVVRQGGGEDIHTSYEPELELTEEFITERVDHAIEYFYKEGINPDGLDLIIEEVGIDEFTAFVIDGPQELNEDEVAYQKAKKKAITGSNRREREGKGEYSPKGSSSPYAKQGLGAKTKKKPKIGHTGTKVVAATKKAKKEQPAKPTSREGLGSRIRSAVSKGVERHKAATKKASGEIKKIAKTASDTAKQHSQHRKDLISGLKATPKERKIAGGIAKGAKKVLTGEELELEAKADQGLDDEGKEDARNLRKYGTKHNQFFQAVRRRQEHRAVRGDKKIKGQKPAPQGAYGEELELEAKKEECKCDCGQDPCIKCGKSHHDVDPRSMGTKYRNIKNRLRSMGLNMSYEPQGNSVDELNRLGKEKGIATGSLNKRPGTPVRKGGDEPGAVRNVRGMIRKETGKPEGQKRRDYDDRHSAQNRPETPAQTVIKRRERKARANAAMMDTSGT